MYIYIYIYSENFMAFGVLALCDGGSAGDAKRLQYPPTVGPLALEQPKAIPSP